MTDQAKTQDAHDAAFATQWGQDILNHSLAYAHIVQKIIDELRQKLGKKELTKLARSFHKIWEKHRHGQSLESLMAELIAFLSEHWKQLAALGFVIHQSTIALWELLELARTPGGSFSEKLFWYSGMKAYSARYGLLAIALLKVAQDEESRRQQQK